MLFLQLARFSPVHSDVTQCANLKYPERHGWVAYRILVSALVPLELTCMALLCPIYILSPTQLSECHQIRLTHTCRALQALLSEVDYQVARRRNPRSVLFAIITTTQERKEQMWYWYFILYRQLINWYRNMLHKTLFEMILNITAKQKRNKLRSLVWTYKAGQKRNSTFSS